MATCRLCGEKAGLFKSAHPECEEKHDAGLSKLSDIAFDTLLRLESDLAPLPGGERPGSPEELFKSAAARDPLGPMTTVESAKQQLEEVRSTSFCSQEEKSAALISAWRRGLEKFTSDKYLSASEFGSLNQYKAYFQIQKILWDAGDLDALRAFWVVSQLQDGRLPSRLEGELPIIFEKAETPLWCDGVALTGYRTIRSYGGGFGGLSIRVAPGLYTRVGAYKGHPIEKTSVQLVDTGLMVLTDRQIYFSGPKVTQKVRYGSIVALEAFEDGIGVRTESAGPKIFVAGERWNRPGLIGWFLHSAISLLCQRAAK